ncbi:hypothetical protein BG011_001822 [Mortierella polycephala]|uniref:Uncharacterized protein n=1 Tax=Mortierella polycephala TaxID=41804 RepID=A0A9P6U5T6_9FUNG|nr:hypothetical protein BG011_001822 [Mortierella polycephala]
MASHPIPGWRRSVGPQWSSVKQHGTGSVPPPAMQQGFHTSYLNAISRPDLNHDYQQQQQQQQQQQLEQHRQQLQQQQQLTPPSSNPSSRATSIMTEHQRAHLQHEENQKQQQLYLQQLQLMQRLQAMPGSTTRPWYPTFGPAITTSCSNSTIQLDNSSQYTLVNNAKLNRQAVGPHWRSIQTSSTFSPTPSPPSSSPLLQTRTLTQSMSDFSSALSTPSISSLSTTSTTTSLHSFFSSTSTLHSSPASIDHARATSFRQLDHEMAPSTDSGLTLTQPVYEEYYQSHSYPHDPHHHPQNNRPENSREARDSMPLANRASPTTPRTAQVSQMTTQCTKRKATWQDRVDEGDEGDEEEDEGSRQGYEDRSQLLAAQSSIQQFVPVAESQSMMRPDQDQEMDNADTGVGTTNDISSTSMSSGMGMETGSMDQELMDATSVLDRTEIGPVNNGSKPRTKRTKPRLDPTMYEIMSAAEAWRPQGGEQMQDIFQECFYNAASSSRS